jgi:hypothetical protein
VVETARLDVSGAIGYSNRINKRKERTMDETIQPQMGLTFERVWAALQETDRLFRESAAKTDRLFQESKAETDRRFQELAEQHKETERFMKESKRELNQAIGKLGNKLGELVEHLVSPNLLKKFNALGYAFSESASRVKRDDVDTGETLAEVDVQLENGGCVLAVEVKTNPSVEDVQDHVKRMETLRAYADAHNDKRDYLGAIAGGIMNENVRNYAIKRGFFALEQSGDTMSIAATPESWEPKRW